MKKSFMSISMLIVSISMLALFLCSTVANAQSSSKYVYNKDGKTEFVYTVDETGRYLTPKLKYEYAKDDKNNSIQKKAYRRNAGERKWMPYYLTTLSEVGNDSVVEYAAWDSKSQTYSLNFQKAVYNKGLENDVLSYESYKWNRKIGNWEIDQHFLLEDYLAGNTDSMN